MSRDTQDTPSFYKHLVKKQVNTLQKQRESIEERNNAEDSDDDLAYLLNSNKQTIESQPPRAQQQSMAQRAQ